MDNHFLQLIKDNQLTSANIQKIYEALSNYSPEKDPAGVLANQYATAALFFAAQIPLKEDHSFLRGELHAFLCAKTGHPLKEADVLCTELCSILAVALPIFFGPADPVEAQKQDARFTLNPACLEQLQTYRVLATLI